MTMDVLGLGCIAVDELLYVNAYPAADSKMPVRRWERQCGGLTATALVAAARLGARAAYAGSLGQDELSRFALECLVREGVDMSHVRPGDAQPIHSAVIVGGPSGSRTIFYCLESAAKVQPDWPPEEVIRAARVLFVDHGGVAGMIRAAQVARTAGVPVVADLEEDGDSRFSELLGLIDHLILSRSFAQRITGRPEPAAAVESLWTSGRHRAVVVTCGGEGCWYSAADAPAGTHHQRAFPVDAIDTTGCGDVFHGAYCAGLVRGLDTAGAVLAWPLPRPRSRRPAPAVSPASQTLPQSRHFSKNVAHFTHPTNLHPLPRLPVGTLAAKRETAGRRASSASAGQESPPFPCRASCGSSGRTPA